MEAPELVRTSLRDFLHVIFKRKFQILLFFLVTCATVAVGTFLVKPTYEASAQILVKTGRESIYVPATGRGNPVMSVNREEQINSEVEILKSKSLAKDVIRSLGATNIYPDLDKQSKGILAWILPESKEDKASTPSDKAFLKLEKKLTVDGIKKSNIIEVSFKHSDPQMTAAVVNTLARLYLDRHLQVHKAPQSYGFFQEQSKLLKQKLDGAEEKLQKLKEQYDVTALDEQQSLFLGQMATLRTSFNETQSLRVEKENRIKQLSQQLAVIPRTILEGEEIDHSPIVINTLEGRLVELQLKEKGLLAKYTEENRLVRNVRDEIQVVQAKLAKHETKRYGKTRSGVNPVYQHLQEELLRSRADLKSLNAKSEAQRQQLVEFQNELEALSAVEVRHNQLEQEVDVERQNYRLYLSKFEESRISDAMDTEKITSVSLIEPAQIPLKPVKPKVLLNLALGLLLGACGGLGLAFFLHYLDDSLETVEEVEETLELPVLASIPELG